VQPNFLLLEGNHDYALAALHRFLQYVPRDMAHTWWIDTIECSDRGLLASRDIIIHSFDFVLNSCMVTRFRWSFSLHHIPFSTMVPGV